MSNTGILLPRARGAQGNIVQMATGKSRSGVYVQTGSASSAWTSGQHASLTSTEYTLTVKASLLDTELVTNPRPLFMLLRSNDAIRIGNSTGMTTAQYTPVDADTWHSEPVYDRQVIKVRTDSGSTGKVLFYEITY